MCVVLCCVVLCCVVLCCVVVKHSALQLYREDEARCKSSLLLLLLLAVAVAAIKSPMSGASSSKSQVPFPVCSIFISVSKQFPASGLYSCTQMLMHGLLIIIIVINAFLMCRIPL